MPNSKSNQQLWPNEENRDLVLRFWHQLTDKEKLQALTMKESIVTSYMFLRKRRLEYSATSPEETLCMQEEVGLNIVLLHRALVFIKPSEMKRVDMPLWLISRLPQTRKAYMKHLQKIPANFNSEVLVEITNFTSSNLVPNKDLKDSWQTIAYFYFIAAFKQIYQVCNERCMQLKSQPVPKLLKTSSKLSKKQVNYASHGREVCERRSLKFDVVIKTTATSLFAHHPNGQVWLSKSEDRKEAENNFLIGVFEIKNTFLHLITFEKSEESKQQKRSKSVISNGRYG